jgi:hypothetical protein
MEVSHRIAAIPVSGIYLYFYNASVYGPASEAQCRIAAVFGVYAFVGREQSARLPARY